MKSGFPLQIETPKNYGGKVDSIKKKLSTYDDDSFFNNMYQHFQRIRDPKTGVISNFPWCCFLALKWKFTEKIKSNPKVMKERDFIDIVNRIYNLQSEVEGIFDNNKILLSIRRMIINQKLYQVPMKLELNTLARQYYWYSTYGGGYFERNFQKLYGITLEDYYKISAYFAIYSCVDDGKESSFIYSNVYLIHLVPYFGAETLKKYLNLVSVKWTELRDFMSLYKDDQQRDIEYYLDTPMLNKPMILTDDGLVILSKHILRASLTALVPSLLKKELSSDYKLKFGKAMEFYVGNLLDEVFDNVIKESEIIKLYRANKIHENTKVVDFIVQEIDGNVYIDSKAIEPDKTVKFSNTALIIKQRLGNSFIKGVLQGQDCARTMNLINKRNMSPKDSLIIITHMDHYISTGKTIEDLLDSSFFEMIEKKYGELSINKDRIYYMTIDEFEFLTEVCKNKNITITSIIDACSKDDSSSKTQKFNVMMHLTDICPDGISDKNIITDTREYLFDELMKYAKDSKYHWDGKVRDFLAIKKYIIS
ncbi:hypothetical protein EOI67_03020 [Salmonella enterica]|nr:hypothetical protein [Salmonella enterica]EEM7110321.1 hypothetical protein [Salmonella enterica subsp. enterica serovar Poona]EEG2845547.1 hypothetical protein [Salmonella enterica]EEG2848847.1 hypothetical protein [Salmonella enterica]EEH1292071.1 hypothetical protein [Salmonella enterica]